MVNTVNKKVVFNNIIWKSLERILSQGVSFAVSVVLARILMPEDYGIVAMVFIFLAIADVFVTSGFSTALIQDKNADDNDFSTIFFCSLIVSVFIYLILFFSAPWIAMYFHSGPLVILLKVLSLRIPICSFNSVQHAWVSRHMQFKTLFLSTITGTVLSGLLGVILALNGFGVWALVGQSFTMLIVDTIVLFFMIPWRPRFCFSLKRAKGLINYGWKIMVADLSGSFFGQLRNIIIGRYYTAADLAFYNRGQQFPFLVFNNIGSSIMSVIFPAISNVGDNIDSAKQMTRRAMRVISYVLFPCLIGIAVIATPLIRLLLTEKWDECIPFVQILSIDYAIAVWSIAPSQALRAIGRSDVILKLEIIKKPFFILLLVIGVRIGLVAIAITMVIYEFYGICINAYQTYKCLGYTIIEQVLDVLPSVLLTIVMSLAMILVEFDDLNYAFLLFLKVIVGCVIYVFLSYLFKIDSLQYLLNLYKK